MDIEGVAMKMLRQIDWRRAFANVEKAEKRHDRVTAIMRLSSHMWEFAVSALIVAGVAVASPPTSNEMGFSYKVASPNSSTVEIRLTPRQSFDDVHVEAGSGVASFTPCGFSPVLVGHTYKCNVTVTGKPSDAAITLNVVARRSVAGSTIPQIEIQHLSLRNAHAVLTPKPKAMAKPMLQSSKSAVDK